MKASEAREKLEEELAKEKVKRFFPIIETACKAKQDSIYIKKGDINDKEIGVLLKVYGYRYRIDQEEGEYDRSGTINGYWLCW